jgi:hypothetical protein
VTHAAAFIAGTDTTLIGEHAATRARNAMEGDNEHAGAKSGLIKPQPRDRDRMWDSDRCLPDAVHPTFR